MSGVVNDCQCLDSMAQIDKRFDPALIVNGASHSNSDDVQSHLLAVRVLQAEQPNFLAGAFSLFSSANHTTVASGVTPKGNYSWCAILSAAAAQQHGKLWSAPHQCCPLSRAFSPSDSPQSHAHLRGHTGFCEWPPARGKSKDVLLNGCFH
eukprot:1160210-Pelagomonas_calceolata.AAC.6